MAGRSKATQFRDVDRATDGRLLATSFNLNVCESCDSGHFDLKDEQDDVFATATIPPESFRDLAAWFTEAAVTFEAKSGRKLD